MVEAMLAPLLELLDVSEAAVKRQVGFVIAEVCSILSLMDDIRGKEAVKSILISISDAVSIFQFGVSQCEQCFILHFNGFMNLKFSLTRFSLTNPSASKHTYHL